MKFYWSLKNELKHRKLDTIIKSGLYCVVVERKLFLAKSLFVISLLEELNGYYSSLEDFWFRLTY